MRDSHFSSRGFRRVRWADQKKRISSGPGAAQRRGDFLDDRAEFGKSAGRRLYQRGDLGIDAGVAEVGAVGDALALDPLMQPRVIGGGAGFQGGVVEWVRTGHHLQEQSGVGDRCG